MNSQKAPTCLIFLVLRCLVLRCFSLFLIAFTIVVPTNAEENEVRIAVSDLLADAIVEPLSSLAEGHSINLSIDAMGSLPAVDYLRSGKIDLAIIATPETFELPHSDFQTCPFAFDVALIAVNKANPVNEISLSSLDAIFGLNNDLNFDVWGDLKIPGWERREIKPLVGQSDDTISLELFKFTVLDGGPMKVTVAEVKDSEVEAMIASDIASIGILPHFSQSQKVKVLMISLDSDSPAFGPTNNNVYYGDYPIRLPFKIIFDTKNMAKLKDTFRLLLSNELADVLLKKNFYVPPVTVRRKLVLDLKLSE